MIYCNYIWRDPKDGTPRYVGWGSTLARPNHHMSRSSNRRLGHLLKKRVREGYLPVPEVVVCAIQTENYAKLVECCWIEKYGRMDLDTGTLFNLTNGGDGATGKVWSQAEREAQAVRQTIAQNQLDVKARNSATNTANAPARMAKRDATIKARTPERQAAIDAGNSAAQFIAQNKPETRALRQEIAKRPLVCPHCGKTGTGPVMYRFHFTNCKSQL